MSTNTSTLHLFATKSTPEVLFSPQQNIYRMVGNSIPENASETYAPVMEWLRNEFRSLSGPVTFDFDLPYFNSSSLKALYLVLLELKKATLAGKEIDLRWYIDENDEFMTEAAETFREMVGLDLKLVAGTYACDPPGS